MAENPFAYIPASQGFYDPPLGLFLPALPKGVAGTWAAENTQPGSLILDPLGAHPMLSIETALAGRRMLVARNNPVLWLMLETIARAPGRAQFWKVLSRLLITRRASETMESHLRSLYATPCAGCGQMIQPIGFVWERDGAQPVSRVYNCPQCGDEGEREISEFDLQNLKRLGSLKLHRARASQRVLQDGEYEQASIESALDCYLPRALYVCMTLANRLEQLDLNKADKQLLQAMFLLVFDDASSLWHWPSRTQYHFQLSVPARFLEKNLWLTLENAPARWGRFQTPVPISYWPNLPDQQGGICLYNRRLSEKEDLFQDEQPEAILSVFPRPNQAFWTLSAIWSGWLWGRKAVTPMRSALTRRRYDWRWFAQALEAAFKDLPETVQTGTRMFGLLPQAAPNHLLGLLVGANASGFELQNFSACHSEEVFQCLWQTNPEPGARTPPKFQEIIRQYLETRGEPCKFQQILSDCLAQIAMQASLPDDISTLEETYFSQIQHQVSEVLRNEHFTQAFQISPTSGSLWWLTDSRAAQSPLAERLELVIRDILWNQPVISIEDLEQRVYQELPGRNTPESEDILVCLQSYADREPDAFGKYGLREGESQSARQKDIKEIITLLEKCAKNFGLYASVDGSTIQWKNKEDI